MNIINLFLVLVTLISQNENNVIEFNRDIRPIISQKCLKCHGLDDSHRKGKLRLDDRSHALKGGKSEPLQLFLGNLNPVSYICA